MGAEDWERFEKTSDPRDRRWIDGLIRAILSDLSSEALRDARRSGDPFELLCVPLLKGQPGVATVDRVRVKFDWNTDLIGKDGDGRPTWYMQCKLWSPTGRKGLTSMNDVASWASKVQAKVMSDWSGISPVEALAVWVTTGPVDDGARRHIDSVNSTSPVRFEIWGPERLCQRLLATHGVGFIRTDPAAGTEDVVVDREALRDFRRAAEAELGESPPSDSRVELEEVERPRFLPQPERQQALEEVLGTADEPMPLAELLARAGEWLGVSEAERRFAEPGKPLPLFEWLMTQALEDMRKEGVVKRHSGQRWSLATQERASGRDEGGAQETGDGVEFARPRFLPLAERRQALEEVLRIDDEPMPFEELLAKTGEWLGLSEEERRFAEPGKPTPLFEFLMTQSLEDLRKEGAAELHSGRRWSLSTQKGAATEASPDESGMGSDPSSAGEVARPRFLSPAERQQALEEVLRETGEPMPFKELLAKTAEWLELSEGEQIYTEQGEPVPFFEHLMTRALEDLRDEGVAELQSGRRWSLAAQDESATKAAATQETASDDMQTVRPRFLPPAERRQALEEVLGAAGEPLPFEELLAKAGEWLGLSEGEQRFTEPGRPTPLFEWLMTQALDDLRKEGVAELHSGRRWSLAAQGEPAVEVRAAQEPGDGADVVRPRFLSQTERRQALGEVLGAAGEPLPFEELLAKAGEWLGLSAGEQRFTEPGRPTPLFEWLMTQALEDLRKEGVAELHSGRRWGRAR